MAEPLTRLVIGLPHLAAVPGEESILLNRKGLLSELAKRSRVFRLSPSGPSSSPEAAWLGLNPEEWSFEQGPLTFSWLKLSPPERSLCFHLSLASLTNGVVGESGVLSMQEELEVFAALKRLDSRKIVAVRGTASDHGLALLNASPDLGSNSFTSAKGKNWMEVMPEGDGSDLLRQWIEDAHELLSKLEFNMWRRDEGKREVNLAWPWGHGRPGVGFNLPLRRGIVVRHLIMSIKAAGLVRLFGDRALLGTEKGPLVSKTEPTVVVLPQVAKARAIQDLDEMDRHLTNLETHWLKPILEQNRSGLSLTVLAPQDGFDDLAGRNHVGLGLNFNTERSGEVGGLPFDERAIWEGEGRIFHLHEAVNLAIMGGSQGS